MLPITIYDFSAMLAPFDLNLRHLRALAAIVASGSMVGAARAVSLSQPALTQGLSKLEARLGARLFDRLPDGMRPTAAGTALAERAQAALAHLAAASRALTRARGFASPELLMTSTQLRALLALTDAGSFVAASAATGLSQPALHRAVRDLEQVCATVLAERRGRGVVLTPAGRRLARGARLAHAEIVAGIVELGGEGGAERLRIGAMPLSRAQLLPRAIAAFTREDARTTVEVVEGSWRELCEPLADGLIDLMVGALRPGAPVGLEQHALFDDRLAVIARAGHPLAGDASPFDALGRYGWIVGQVGTPLRAQWDALFAAGVRPPALIECGSVMVIRGLLRESDLLALLSPAQVEMELAAGILARIGPPIAQGVRTIGMTMRAGWRPTAAQRRFVALLHAGAQRIQENQ